MATFERGKTGDRSSEDSDTECFDGIGPMLPPHLRKKQCSKNNTEYVDNRTSESRVTIGPTLPSQMKSPTCNETENVDYSKCEIELQADKCSESAGPHLPPHLQGRFNCSDSDDDDELYGPALPPSSNCKISETSNYEESNDVIGPLPFQENSDTADRDIQQSFNRRAQLMKQKLTGKDEDELPRREKWMLELPEEHAVKFGLGPRKFHRREPASSGDRSVWTDTPADRERKKNKQERHSTSKTDMQDIAVTARDNKMLELAESYSGMRPQESLLETHQKELKRKRKKDAEEGKQQVRRPFDRNIDLQANQLNEAQKQGVFKMARLLDDRFASGKSKFL